MSISYIEFDKLWNQSLIENEKFDKQIENIQIETLQNVETIISNPHLYSQYIVNEAIKIKESLLR